MTDLSPAVYPVLHRTGEFSASTHATGCADGELLNEPIAKLAETRKAQSRAALIQQSAPSKF